MSSNIDRLKIIAAGLGDLCKDVVFVGGSVANCMPMIRQQQTYARLWMWTVS